MAAFRDQRTIPGPSNAPDERVRTVISCPGVHPMSRADDPVAARDIANENAWLDPVRLRRHRYANVASLALALVLLLGGVWIVTEFVRLQKLEACFEAGRRDCMPLDLARRQNTYARN